MANQGESITSSATSNSAMRMQPGCSYILKPDDGCQGSDIHIVQDVPQVVVPKRADCYLVMLQHREQLFEFAVVRLKQYCKKRKTTGKGASPFSEIDKAATRMCGYCRSTYLVHFSLKGLSLI
jgi:hypothetical protein